MLVRKNINQIEENPLKKIIIKKTTNFKQV